MLLQNVLEQHLLYLNTARELLNNTVFGLTIGHPRLRKIRIVRITERLRIIRIGACNRVISF